MPSAQNYFSNSVFIKQNLLNDQIEVNISRKCKVKQTQTRNTKSCNNSDDLPNLSFILKISIFSDTCLEPSRISMMKLFC